MKAYLAEVLKPVMVMTAISMGLNMMLLGPEQTIKQFIAFYQKPETTVYPLGCVLPKCGSKIMTCLRDTKCWETIKCINKCTVDQPKEKVASCAYICEMVEGYENEPFLDLLKCNLENNCMADYPPDGKCIGTDNDALKSVTSLEQVAGDWWMIRGVNCGHGDWPGGYDGYPCQHERFIQDKGQWINNVTYCAGEADKCISQMIVTIANVSIPSPGVIHVSYTDAPLAPQDEDWRILSWPDQGDYMFIFWCGKLPVLEYNGGLVMSRRRSDEDMPKEILEEFISLAAKYGIDYYKDMCSSNNKDCLL